MRHPYTVSLLAAICFFSTPLHSKNLTKNTLHNATVATAMLPKSDIATVRSQANGTVVVTGGRVTVSTQLGGVQIFIQDPTGGISVYGGPTNLAAIHGLKLGDSVEVTGTMGEFYLLKQINVSSLIKINVPATVLPSKKIKLSEMGQYEGQLVHLDSVNFPPSGGNYAASTNYNFGSLQVRIISGGTPPSNNIVGTPIISGTGSVIGIAGRFSATYQVLPRFIDDLKILGVADKGADATFSDDAALEVVAWNVEWFGHPQSGPADNTAQLNKAAAIMNTLKADIYELNEISDLNLFSALVNSVTGYSGVCSAEYSYSNIVNPDPLGQRLCFVYKTAVFSNVQTQPLLTEYKNNPALLTDYPNTATRFWASGRLPFMLTADVTLNNTQRRLGFVGIHARANSNASAQDSKDTYNMRQYDVAKMKDYLDTQHPHLPFFILGDFNDDLDQTIATGITGNLSSYSPFLTDSVHYSLFSLALSLSGQKSTVTYNEMIDHIIGSNETATSLQAIRVGTPTIYTANYGSSTSDHLPVMAKFDLTKINNTTTSVSNAPIKTIQPLKIYPNPAKNWVRIDGVSAIKSVQIFSIQGQLMKKSPQKEIDISDLEKGIYLLVVEYTEGGRSRVKFVKE